MTRSTASTERQIIVQVESCSPHLADTSNVNRVRNPALNATAASRPNAKIILRRIGDFHGGEARLLAERLGLDRRELSLVGVDARVERVGDSLVLFWQRDAVVGRLVSDSIRETIRRSRVTPQGWANSSTPSTAEQSFCGVRDRGALGSPSQAATSTQLLECYG